MESNQSTGSPQKDNHLLKDLMNSVTTLFSGASGSSPLRFTRITERFDVVHRVSFKELILRLKTSS
jgi:hypothetical protein